MSAGIWTADHHFPVVVLNPKQYLHNDGPFQTCMVCSYFSKTVKSSEAAINKSSSFLGMFKEFPKVKLLKVTHKEFKCLAIFLIPWTVTDFQCRKQAAVRHGLGSYSLLREKKKRDRSFICMRLSYPKTVSTTIDPALCVTSMRSMEEMHFFSQYIGVWEKSQDEFFYLELWTPKPNNTRSSPPSPLVLNVVRIDETNHKAN